MARRLNIIARLRPQLFRGQRVVAVRWALDAGEPFPVNGFLLERNIGGVVTAIAPALRLPGAIKAAKGSWSIDLAELGQDLLARRAPYDGARRIPDLPDAATASALVPFLTFALPEGSDDACQNVLPDIAAALNNEHERDPSLTVRYWNYQRPPPIVTLAGMRGSATPREAAIYDALVGFYRNLAVTLLLELAGDFGAAKFLGLGFDDLLPGAIAPGSPDPTPDYAVTAQAATNVRSVCTALDLKQTCALPPANVDVDRAVAMLAHPRLASFYRPGAIRTPPLPAGANPILKSLAREAARPARLYPGPAAHLSWLPIKPEGDENPLPLNFQASRWRVERHRFARSTASDGGPPKLGFKPVFRPCAGGEAILAKTSNDWVDDLAMPIGALPFEGWHAYRVRGIDQFGMAGAPSAPALIRLRDEIPPPPPDLASAAHRIDLPVGGKAKVGLSLDWGVQQELSAPDASEFRLRQIWTGLLHIKLFVDAVDPGAPGDLVTDVKIVTPTGESPDEKALRQLIGGTVLAENGEFSILDVVVAKGPMLRVQRSSGAPPALGGVAVRMAIPSIETGASDPVLPVRLLRRPATVAKATLLASAPLTMRLIDSNHDNALPANPGRVHLVALNCTFTAVPDGVPGVFVLTPDPGPPDQPPATTMAVFSTLAPADAGAFLDGSPAFFLPAHDVMMDLVPPDHFVVGTLEIRASAADAAPYQGSAVLPGNEGQSTSALFTAYDMSPPGPVTCRFVPKIWARGAAEYVDEARVDLEWPDANRALCFEVERALETAIGVGSDIDDDVLIETACRLNVFERRTNSAYGTRWSDDLPGRAPTRAVYRVRPVTAANVPGDWTTIAVVRVPDVRIAPPPNLVLAAPPDVEDRAIALRWFQAGPLRGIGFRVEARRTLPLRPVEEGWEQVASFIPGQLTRQADGSFTTVLIDQSPGLWREFRVFAVRRALDPRDPRAIGSRDMDGRCSNVMRAYATGNLRPPSALAARLVGGHVELHWTNVDHYEAIEVRRRRPGGYGFERCPVSGIVNRYREPTPLSAGIWTYELAGIGSGRRVMTDRVQIDIP